jgi:hypothetical protein
MFALESLERAREFPTLIIDVSDCDGHNNALVLALYVTQRKKKEEREKKKKERYRSEFLFFNFVPKSFHPRWRLVVHQIQLLQSIFPY